MNLEWIIELWAA